MGGIKTQSYIWTKHCQINSVLLALRLAGVKPQPIDIKIGL
jgi:hypothetical protein